MNAVLTILASVILIAIAGLALWFLVPIATAGAVTLTLTQGFATAAVVYVTGGLVRQ